MYTTDSTALLSNRFENVNIFDLIGSVKAFPFLSDNETLRIMLNLEYGSRVVANQFMNISNEDLAKYLVLKFGDSWMKLIDPDFDLLANNVQVIDEKGNHQQSSKSESDVINKISAYNEVDLITDSGTGDKGFNELTGSNDKLTKIYYQNLNNYWTNLDELGKINVYKVVCYNIVTAITLSIY